MNISKKYILEIREFMKNFLDLEYDGDQKLTHAEFNDYMTLKKRPHATRVSFDMIKNESILNGTYILVRDDIGKVIQYRRPSFDLKTIFKQVNVEQNKINSDLVRKRYLEEQGYREISNGEIIPIEEELSITQKLNRIKVLKKRGIR